MPLYEYVCASCSGKFERYVRSFGEAVACPACAGTEVEKQLSTFALAGGQGDSAPSAGGGGSCCGGGGCGCGPRH